MHLKDQSLTGNVSLLYISPVTNGSSFVTNRFSLDINLRKTLWKNKASLSLGIIDIFNAQNFTQTTKYLNQDFKLNSRIENRLLTFGFTYKFGNFSLNTNKKEMDLRERDRLNK